MMNEKIRLNDGWQFSERFFESLHDPSYHSPALIPVRLPHTVREIPLRYAPDDLCQKVTAYRRILDVPAEWAQSRVILRFEGVAHAAKVYVNGALAAAHFFAFTAFSADVTDHLRFGRQNAVVVRVDSYRDGDIPPFGGGDRSYVFGGIHREVTLEIKPYLYIEQLFAPACETEGIPQLSAEVTLNKPAPAGAVLQLRLEGKDGRVVFSDSAAFDGKTALIRGAAPDAGLWSPEHPELFRLSAELTVLGVQLDAAAGRVGFRSAECRGNGFYLNGVKTPLAGVGRNQVYPYAGYALPRRPQRLDADILKFELSVGAVYTDAPPSRHFLNRCDEIGLLVFPKIPGTGCTGGHDRKDRVIEAVREMITQLRNHPSVMLWGVRPDFAPDDSAFDLQLKAVAERMDPTRKTACLRTRPAADDPALLIPRERNPLPAPKNGDFRPPGLINRVFPPRFQKGVKTVFLLFGRPFCSARRTVSAGDGLSRILSHARMLDSLSRPSAPAGGFGPFFADEYVRPSLGEEDGRRCLGLLDVFRNPKPIAALYQSQTGLPPVLSVTGWNGGRRPGFFALTNADSVRLYRNGIYAGSFSKDTKKYPSLRYPPIRIDDLAGNLLTAEEGLPKGAAKHMKALLQNLRESGFPRRISSGWHRLMLRFLFRVSEKTIGLLTEKYGAGSDQDASFRFDGIIAGEVAVSVTKEPLYRASVEIKADTDTLRENGGYDVASVRFRAVDQNGETLRRCRETLQLFVTGPLEILGPFVLSLEDGMGGCYLKTTGKPGEGTLAVLGGTLGNASVKFTVL